MDIPVLLEPTPTGWRATTGAPLNLFAEGPDKDALLATFREQIVRKYIDGARIAVLTFPECDPLLDIVKRMAAEPAMEEWLQIMRDRRNEPDPHEPDEDTQHSPASNGIAHPVPDALQQARP